MGWLPFMSLNPTSSLTTIDSKNYAPKSATRTTLSVHESGRSGQRTSTCSSCLPSLSDFSVSLAFWLGDRPHRATHWRQARKRDNHAMHRSGGGQLFCLLATCSPPPGVVYRYRDCCASSSLCVNAPPGHSQLYLPSPRSSASLVRVRTDHLPYTRDVLTLFGDVIDDRKWFAGRHLIDRLH